MFSSLLFQWSYPDFDKPVREIIHYVHLAGLAAGCILGSFLSDGLGRRRIMFVAYSGMCVFQCCSALTDHWLSFAIAQVLVGISAGMYNTTVNTI